MTVVSLKTLNTPQNGAFKAEFSDGSLLLFSTDYLPEWMTPASLEAGYDLIGQDEEAFRFAAACYMAEKDALRLIARAEQNSLRLTAKLEQKKHKAAVVKAVVSCLLDRDLLNDERYSELWLRSRLSRGKKPSPRRLRVSLAQRGIDKHSSRRALENVLDSETEYSLLLEYLEQAGVRENEKPPLSRAQLKSEGFSTGVLDRYYSRF